MFPVASTESIFSGDMNPLTRAYRDVVIYDDAGADAEPLYEGPIVVHGNGWLELEGGRLLSPSAVHHIDIYDDIDESGDRGADERNTDDDNSGDYRTSRFSPR
ncbi:hypothetical protein [Natronorubrum sp. DTA28]|uniref:hypothetical protein n=1 Tax=Natronorubrum sp. DTA28 TaxID=3447019 RepID=UPI003F864573